MNCLWTGILHSPPSLLTYSSPLLQSIALHCIALHCNANTLVTPSTSALHYTISCLHQLLFLQLFPSSMLHYIATTFCCSMTFFARAEILLQFSCIAIALLHWCNGNCTATALKIHLSRIGMSQPTLPCLI